jgi:two-component system, response regulator
MPEKTIFLVEDSDNEAELAVRALRRTSVNNPLVRVRDGVEALNYIFGRGAFAGRDVRDVPAVTLLDLNIPKIDGLEVLKAIRADIRTRTIPVVILTPTKIAIGCAPTNPSPIAMWSSQWITISFWQQRGSLATIGRS